MKSPPSVFEVGVGITTPVITETALNSRVYTKNIADGGSIVLNETNKTAVITCYLSTTEANGFTLGEIGIFNMDIPKIMESRDVFTGILKTNQDEITFILTTVMQNS